jgi:hypothetical protein
MDRDETLFVLRQVSIRAPVLGATWGDSAARYRPGVSIRAPVLGATPLATHIG